MKSKIVRVGICWFFVVFLVTLFCIVSLPIEQIIGLPNEINLSYEDLQNIEYKNIKVINNIETSVDAEGFGQGTITLKAFGVFPLRRIKAKVGPKRIVFGGGYPIGMILKSNGVVVINGGSVTVNDTDVENVTKLQKGDIIKKINGRDVLRIKDIATILNSKSDTSYDSSENAGLKTAIIDARQQDLLDIACNGLVYYFSNCSKDNFSIDVNEDISNEVVLNIERQGKLMDIKATPMYDTVTKEYKLGVWVKDKVAGLGTVTYVKPNGKYGALGHAIIDCDTQEVFPCFVGKAYNSKVVGCEKGAVNKPGSLKGVFNLQDSEIGTIEKNTKYGVFGVFDKCDKNDTIYEVASRITVKPGKASIITTVDDEMKEYDIDIIKATKQKNKNDKGLIVKVTDKELLKKTGGIVQGMSGSPIIQNNKIVGAITHVFINDPTKGYGVYLDWMLEN